MPALDESSFVYVIAGGETLTLIDRLKADAVVARQELEKLAQGFGASLSINNYNNPFFSFKGEMPPGWTAPLCSEGATPDEETPLGQQIARDIYQQSSRLKVSYQFNEACAKSCGACRGPSEYSFEEIGDKIVVKCPPNPLGGDQREYFIPPDSTPITFAQYAKMREDAGLIITTTAAIKPFVKKFDV